MARQVFVRSGVGGEGIPKVAAATIVLGRFVEHVADTTVQQAQVNSAVVAGVAFASQARSLFQSDGVTARADGTVYAAEYLTVGVQGIYSVECDASHAITVGCPVKTAADGKAIIWVQGADAQNRLIGRAVGSVYNVTVAGVSTPCVDVRLI